jgi:preprotein translocase subunit SecD
MKAFACFLLLLGLALSAAAADVTGKWSGSFNMTRPNGETKEAEAMLDLKQNGSEITGSVGPNESERYPIAKGKIEGNKITLESAEGEGPAIKFDLVLEGDHIKGDASASKEGETLKAKLDLTRMKS